MDYFTLTRSFWDFAFENPDKIKPNHCALFLFIVEHNNRLGWRDKLGLPTTMAKEAIGIRSYNTYMETLNDLVDFGLIILVEKSKNQFSSNIVALSNFDKAPNKALDKALIKHDTKQGESTVQSTDSIIKQNNNIIYSFEHLSITELDFSKLLNEYKEEDIFDCFEKIQNYKQNKKYKSLYLTAKTWLKKDYKQKDTESELPEDKRIDWKIFLDYFNDLFNPKIKLSEVPEQTKKRYLNLLQCGFSKDHLLIAFDNAKKDRENLTDVTIDTFSYSSMVSKYQKDVTKIGML
jgi:hypothetical protein